MHGNRIKCIDKLTAVVGNVQNRDQSFIAFILSSSVFQFLLCFDSQFMDDQIVNQRKGELYSICIDDDIVPGRAASPAPLHKSKLEILVTQVLIF
jgi:hypothetical protein